MGIRLKTLSDQVMVITGASSGIGLVTARLAAKAGARLVLAARNDAALADLADEINENGGEAVEVPADVGDQEAVRDVAETAIATFGGFDTWVNNAGIGIYGNTLDVAIEDMRQLFETNFWGVVYGSLEAARHLRDHKDGYGGAIINVGSEASERALVLMGMYSASKHAVKAFTDGLRMDLEMMKAPISVTLVKPTAIDTPFPQHAKNYLEREPQLPSPMYTPDVVAKAILHCAQKPVRDVYVGGPAKAHAVQEALVPRLVDRMMESTYVSKQKSDKPPNASDDALYRPTTGLRERGHSQGKVRTSSAYTNASLHPLLTGAILAGAGVALASLLAAGTSAASRTTGGRSTDHEGGRS